jgi:TraM recognition site of TraD and TraG/Type IV secretion-system coupling protein DNA-binding domain
MISAGTDRQPDVTRADRADSKEFDLVGFTITPTRSLHVSDQKELDLEIESLLASLAFAPPGVRQIAFDLRYLAVADDSLAGKQLVVALLCRLNFDDAPGTDTKQISADFRREFGELLSLHLEKYDYRISIVRTGGDLWKFLEPFTVSDYVNIMRRITRLRPIRISTLQGRSPMSRAVDMLLRQPSQTCLSVYLEPHLLSDQESRDLEYFGYETDLLPTEDRELRTLRSLLSAEDGAQSNISTPFRMAIRIASDQPISQYLINLIGAEVSGRKDYSFHRPSATQLSDAASAFRELRFHTTSDERAFQDVPPSLRNLFNLFHLTEVQAAFRLPAERIATSRERTFRTYHAPVANLPHSGMLLGHAEHPSYHEPLPVYLQRGDRRRHVYVVGKTGTGKSMLLLNSIRQDLLAGSGLCVVDPHGDLVSSVLPYIPPSRAGDVVLLDPADPERVAGMNFLEATSLDDASEKDFLVQEIISGILRMVDYNIEMYGPIAQQMTRMACQTLMALDAPATLLEVPRLFSSDEFRQNVLRRVRDRDLLQWWANEWAPKTQYQKHEVMGYFTSKFEQFVSAPAVRHMVGQAQSTFDFKRVMDQGGILLVNLSRGRIGSINSATLGGMIVSKLLWAATRRAWDPEETRRDFYLYVDEFQNFISDSFDTILSEARKYRLNLVIAHQHLGQLRAMGRLGDRVERAVFGNVGTMVTFRVGTDAARIADELGSPVDAGTLRSLQNRFCVAQLLVDEIPTTPFTMKTADYQPPSQEQIATGQRIGEQARQRNRPISDIKSDIQRRALSGEEE